MTIAAIEQPDDAEIASDVAAGLAVAGAKLIELAGVITHLSRENRLPDRYDRDAVRRYVHLADEALANLEKMRLT